MIYTVTFNPSLDYTVRLKTLQVGGINRAYDEVIYPGGKGINVSVVLNNLGVKSKVYGYIAGFTGCEIERMVKAAGCETDFIKIGGMSRINMQIKAEHETGVNGRGPRISDESLNELFDKLSFIKNGDVLVLAGSIPASLPDNIYETILSRLSGRDVLTVVDAEDELLLKVLKYKPFLVKPNNFELADMVKRKLNTKADIVFAANELKQLGARNVLVSLGGDGAILVDENSHVYSYPAPKGKMVNTVGAGDSMVAGFLYGYLNGLGYDGALKVGLCAGSATAFKDWLATKDEIDALLKTM